MYYPQVVHSKVAADGSARVIIGTSSGPLQFVSAPRGIPCRNDAKEAGEAAEAAALPAPIRDERGLADVLRPVEIGRPP